MNAIAFNSVLVQFWQLFNSYLSSDLYFSEVYYAFSQS